jgi:hypothetical protein
MHNYSVAYQNTPTYWVTYSVSRPSEVHPQQIKNRYNLSQL